MGGGGSKPREIEQENKQVNEIPINTRGLINTPPEKFQDYSLDTDTEYHFISHYNFYYSIYIIIIFISIFIFLLFYLSCNHPFSSIKIKRK